MALKRTRVKKRPSPVSHDVIFLIEVEDFLKMIQDKQLYWKYLKVWIYGGLLSFSISSLFGYLLNKSDPILVVPAMLSILFFPVFLCGILGIWWGYCPSRKLGYIHRGNIAIFLNSFIIFIYFISIAYAFSSKFE